jgi:hypothetical protein
LDDSGLPRNAASLCVLDVALGVLAKKEALLNECLRGVGNLLHVLFVRGIAFLERTPRIPGPLPVGAGGRKRDSLPDVVAPVAGSAALP